MRAEMGRSEARLIRAGIEKVLAGHVAREAPAPLADQPGHDVGSRGEFGVRPRWVSRESYVRQFVDRQADPALSAELRDLAPDVTDELPDR